VLDGGSGRGHEAFGVLDALGQRQRIFRAARSNAMSEKAEFHVVLTM
jgi:hypothetical protein